MHITFNKELAANYKSYSQKARVVTEDWVNKEVYCPNCGNISLEKYANNKPAADFYCQECHEDFELKSKRGEFGIKIIDGAYKSMIGRLADVNNPNFFLLSYNLISYQVTDLFIIPKHFFTPSIIEERPPLNPSARRHGFIGCNILLERIPSSGRIFLVKNMQVQPKDEILSVWKKTLFLRDEKKPESKGWLLDVMKYIETTNRIEFSLADIYKFESPLSRQHPDNRHIKDKIRQQLQILRDRNYIEFIGRGKYRII